MPQITRKTKRDIQSGANVQPSVARKKTLKDQKRTGFRPIVSLRGLKTKGPIQYPIRKIAVGKTFWLFPDRPNSCRIAGTALLGKEDDTPLLSTTMSATTALYIFLFYFNKVSSFAFAFACTQSQLTRVQLFGSAEESSENSTNVSWGDSSTSV